MSGTIITVLLVVFILYCFVGIRSFIPYFLGILQGCLTFFIDIISKNIYPVGTIVYIVFYGSIVYLVFNFLVLPFLHKKS